MCFYVYRLPNIWNNFSIKCFLFKYCGLSLNVDISTCTRIRMGAAATTEYIPYPRIDT